MSNFLSLMMVLLLLAPVTVMAASAKALPTIEDLQLQIKDLSEQLVEMDDRVGVTERHVGTDHLSLYGDLRTRVHTTNQSVILNQGGPLSTFDEKNDLVYDTRLRLGMKAKVVNNVKFMGRLLMYKNWGDSTGVKDFDSWSSYTMDGSNGGNTTGDQLHVERAFFVWTSIAHSQFYLSIGRRPSTYGAPTNFRENEPRGGTPSGHLVNYNFDGLTLGYHLSAHTGVEGQTLRFCYGEGFESQVGNGTLAAKTSIEDTHLGGFNFDVWNDGISWLQLTAFGATNITDGFKGLAVLPAAPGTVPNSYVSRMAATTNVGSMFLGGLGTGYETENGANFFASFGYNRTMPNDNTGPFGGMLSDASGGVDEGQNGYSLYIGTQMPAPMGKFGLEYNYGSKYWFAFTQAQDDILGSKLLTRGHVGEAYYIFNINRRTFIKLDALYYKYDYTGSGSIIGNPQKISDVKNGSVTSMLPVVEDAYDVNATFTIKF